jgi:hypothetical protein
LGKCDFDQHFNEGPHIGGGLPKEKTEQRRFMQCLCFFENLFLMFFCRRNEQRTFKILMIVASFAPSFQYSASLFVSLFVVFAFVLRPQLPSLLEQPTPTVSSFVHPTTNCPTMADERFTSVSSATHFEWHPLTSASAIGSGSINSNPAQFATNCRIEFNPPSPTDEFGIDWPGLDLEAVLNEDFDSGCDTDTALP